MPFDRFLVSSHSMEYVSANDELYIRRCLQLARNGAGSTSPNPMVGAVIVCDGRIIGEGYHIRCGEPHAEVNAVRSVKACDKALLKRATIYVSLEPCSHYGKTPPCCDLIISCGFPRVVVATTDYNSMVNGGGIAKMRAAGIEVVVGVLDDDAVALNKSFFTVHCSNRPFVILKWAESADGFIDRIRQSGEPLRISNSGSQLAVHKLRSECDAILVGTRTALLDNPSLTMRMWAGRKPLRLVVDRLGVLPATLNLFDSSCATIVFTQKIVEGKFGGNVEQLQLDFSGDIPSQILSCLVSRKINTLLVEGGASLLQSFIDCGLWDLARVEKNPKIIVGDGVKAPLLPQVVKSNLYSCFGNEISIFVR